jgi:tetratricopeptide (TPR) repeat protein
MIQDDLNLAVQHEQAGRLAEAEKICRSILATQPNLPGAWHVLSIIAARAGRPDVAVDLIQRGIEIDPNNSAMHTNLGEFHRRLKNLDAAIGSLRRAIELQPGLVDAWNNLGNALKDKGMLDDALAAYKKAIALQPNSAKVHYNIGIALRLKGDPDQSISSFDQAIAIEPTYADAHNGRGNALRDKGRFDEAIAEYQKAIQFQPDSAAPHANLGNALTDQRQFDAAIVEYQKALQIKSDYPEALANLANALRETKKFEEASAAARAAIELKPDYAEAHDNLGIILFDQEGYAEAINSFRKAIELKPSSAVSHNNLALALDEAGQLEEAIRAGQMAVQLNPGYAIGLNTLGNLLAQQGHHELALQHFRKAVALEPGSAAARWNLARELLLLGHIKEAWAEFDSRLQIPHLRLKQNFPQPEWDGSDPTGKVILLHAEGGHGDTLQFIRFAPQVARRGAKLILECQPALVPLLERMTELDYVIARGQPLPRFDWQIPLLSLPRVLGTTLENIPCEVPYLSAPTDRVQRWKKQLGADTKLRVGLVWSGSRYTNKEKRSRTIDVFAPLAQVPNVKFFSLQTGDDSRQAPPQTMDWADFSAELKDFTDTAALVQNFDLVVTIDTSVAHLAGALAKPVWVLIPFQCDSRWLLHRTDSPWYPTMRLFRQPKPGSWESPIAQMVAALRRLK